MHKQIALFIGLTLFLAACTPPAAPPTATQVSLPSVPSVTLTVTPSSTGTATITTTTTPSVTPTTLTPTPMLPSATATLPPPTATATLPPHTATLTLMPTATRATTVRPTRRPSATPIPIPPTPDFSNLGSGKIVFSSQHYNPAAELSIVDLKTNRTLRLIGNLFTNNISPRLSPDGTQVIFTSLFNGNQEIFMLKVDELTLKNFPEDLEETLNATDWLEKLGITQLTHTDYDEYHPTWSPDGKLIAYSALIDHVQDLYILPLAGGQPVWITKNLFISNPEFSPDGQKFVFEEDSDGHGTDIAWIPAGGGSRRKLTNIEWENERNPTWSPNGTKIAYCKVFGNQYEIVVMNADGSNAKRLTDNLTDDCKPSWSPDGSRMIFISDRDGFHNLFVMDADGGNVRQLTYFNRKNTALSADWGK